MAEAPYSSEQPQANIAAEVQLVQETDLPPMKLQVQERGGSEYTPESRALTVIRKLATVGLALSLTAGADIVGADPAMAACSGTRCDAAGTIELASSSWLDGHGVDIYSNGSNVGNDSGTSCVTVAGAPAGGGCVAGSVRAGEEWQCVELANRLYLTKGWITSHWSGSGDQLYANAPAGLTREANGKISQIAPGDVISLGDTTTGTADDDGGHAAIVNTVTVNADGSENVSIVNQNTPDVNSSAVLTKGTLNMNGWEGYNVIGVIEAPNSSTSSLSSSSSPNGPAIAMNQSTGLATAVAVGPNNSLYAYWQDAVDGQWSGPLGIDGGAAGIAYSKPAVAINPQTGLATAVVEGPNHSLYAYWQDSIDGPWTGPFGIDGGAPGIAYSAPSIAFNPTTGLATVAAEGPNNSLYAYWQNSVDGSWSGPLGLDNGAGGIAYSAPSIAFNAATQTATAVARGPNNSLYAYWQDGLNGQWSGPLGLDGGSGGIAYSAPSIDIDQTTGKATAVAEGPGGSLYGYLQNTVNGQWTGPIGIAGGAGGIADSAPSLAMNQSTETTTVVAEGPDSSLRAYWQTAIDGSWTGPLGIDSGDPNVAYSDPAVAVNNSTGLVTATAEGPSNSLYTYWQNTLDGQWTGPLGLDNGQGGIAY